MFDFDKSEIENNRFSIQPDGTAHGNFRFIRYADKCGELFKAEGLSADHFFTTRNTDLSNLPFDVIRAEKQIHSAEVVYINEENYRDKHFRDGFVISAESFGKNQNHPGIGIRTADCTPILMYDPDAMVVSAVHAGWRGTVGKPEAYRNGETTGIAANAVRAMCKRGASPDKIQVAIGACIHSCCFEVREDFISAVRNAVGECADRFLIVTETNGSKKHFFDLPALNIYLLQSCGVKSENISLSPCCTACDTKTFFSFRAEHGLSGTMLSAIRI